MHLPFILECMVISFPLKQNIQTTPTVFEDRESLIRILKYPFELVSIINFINLYLTVIWDLCLFSWTDACPKSVKEGLAK